MDDLEVMRAWARSVGLRSDDWPDELATLHAIRTKADALRAALGEPVAVVAPEPVELERPRPTPTLTRADVVAWLRTAPLEEIRTALAEAKVCDGWTYFDDESGSLHADSVDVGFAEGPQRVALAQLGTLAGSAALSVSGVELEEYGHDVAIRAAEDQAIAAGYRVPWREAIAVERATEVPRG